MGKNKLIKNFISKKIVFVIIQTRNLGSRASCGMLDNFCLRYGEFEVKSK